MRAPARLVSPVSCHRGMPDPLNMASSGKKGKKQKGKTISLNSFLQETPGTVNTVPLRKGPSNWADEVEDTYDSYDGGRNAAKNANVVLPTAPKAARGLEDLSQNIPSSPPFNVYLSNLPYDVEEDEIEEFFEGLKIVSMRIPREDRAGEAGRVRGFGYVEFEDQASLIEALDKPGCILKGRRIRIEVATNSDSDKRRGGRMDMNRDRQDRPEAPTGDWRSFGRQEPEGPPRREFNRDGGPRGGEERSGGMWRDGGERPSFRDRDGDRPSYRDRDDRPSYREPREDKPITRDAPPRFDSSERGDRDRGGERRAYGRRERDDRPIERSGMGGDRYERGGERNGEEPRMRPKLNLAPRSVPVQQPAEAAPVADAAAAEEGGDEKVAEHVPAAAAVPAASIFGSAKPVDTTAREREIEQRLAKVEIDDRRDDRRKDVGRRRSPERRRYSPRRASPRGGDSPERRRDSPERSERRRSPEIRRGGSPERRRGAEERKPVRNDRTSSRDNRDHQEKERRAPREYTERDMPKVKTPEPINIVGPNKYAYLSDEGED